MPKFEEPDPMQDLADCHARIAELKRERDELLPIISRLLEAHMDGYNLSGDEIDDAYRALGDQP